VVEGKYADPDTNYLSTIDDCAVNAALEETPFDTPPARIGEHQRRLR
jgi:hypothetical protein